MIKFSLTFISFIVGLVCCYGQLSQTVNVTQAGTLSTLLADNKTKVTDLTLTGTINDQDFQTIKQMSLLKNLDMSAVNIDNGAIPESAFSGRVMNKLVLPVSLKSIGVNAFCNAILSQLDFSKCLNLETIRAQAFSNLSIKNNNMLDFSKCSKFINFEADNNNGVFTGYAGHVILPNYLEVIPTLTFSRFKGIVDLSLSLKTIQDLAFSNAIIEEISLPRSVTYIGNSAFYNCTKLSQIISNNPTPPTLGRSVFGNINIPNCRLTVPDRGLELYAVADQWKDFINTMQSVSGLRAIDLPIYQQEETSISIYPNPTTDVLNVLGDDIQQVVIYDLTGRQVLKTTQSNSISVNNLSNGTYIVKVKTSTGETSHKVIKK